MTSLLVSSMATRYEGCINLVDVDEAKVSGSTRVHCRDDIFLSAERSLRGIKVDADGITDKRSEWPSTSPDQMTANKLCHMLALLASREEDWGKLWLSCTMRAHMIVIDLESNTVYYVISAGQWSS